MKIVVLSDSHTDSIDRLPRKSIDELSGADFIFHLGDYTGRELLGALRRFRNFNGVHGNMDPQDIKHELPAMQTIEVAGHRIGINHPSEGGLAAGIEERVRAKFRDVDIVVYGHTHKTKNEYKNGILYFNPGSVTGTFPAMTKTFGIINITEGVSSEIVTV